MRKVKWTRGMFASSTDLGAHGAANDSFNSCAQVKNDGNLPYCMIEARLSEHVKERRSLMITEAR